ASIFIVTPPHWVEYLWVPTTAKVCIPGVVSPPVAATWTVFLYQSNASGVPSTAGAEIQVSCQGSVESSLLNPFQSPAKTSGLILKSEGFHQRGEINSVFH